MVLPLLAGVLIAIVGVVVNALSVYQLGVARAMAKWSADQWSADAKPRVGRTIALLGVLLGLGLIAAGVAIALLSINTSQIVRVALSALGAVAVGGGGGYLSIWVTDRVELATLLRAPAPLYRTAAAEPTGVAGSRPNPAGFASSPVAAARSQAGPQPVPQASPGVLMTAPTVSHSTQTASQTNQTVNHDGLTRAPSSPAAPNQNPPNPSPLAAQAGGHPALPLDAQPGWVYQDAGGQWFLAVAVPGGHGLVRIPDFATVPAEDVTAPLTLAGSVELTVWPLADAGLSTQAPGAAELVR